MNTGMWEAIYELKRDIRQLATLRGARQIHDDRLDTLEERINTLAAAIATLDNRLRDLAAATRPPRIIE